jgi:hypothetical protein
MYIVAIGWLYVTLMMAVAEATSSNGTVTGAVLTFVLYGAAPVSLAMYLMGTPGRRRRRAHEANSRAAAASVEPDRGGQAPAGAAIPPVREEP